jgi:hypothetical protein
MMVRFSNSSRKQGYRQTTGDQSFIFHERCENAAVPPLLVAPEGGQEALEASRVLAGGRARVNPLEYIGDKLVHGPWLSAHAARMSGVSRYDMRIL